MSVAIGQFKREQLHIRPPREGEVRCLSLLQPWASALFVLGLKSIETRSWKTNYRGRLYIHASKGFPKYARDFATVEHTLGRLPDRLPFASIIGHVDLIDIQRTDDLLPTISPIEKLYGDYGPRRYGWITSNPVLLDEPIPARGSLGIWKYKPEESRAV